MSCTGGLSDLPNFGCGGRIKRIVLIDEKGEVKDDILFRKWQTYTIEELKYMEKISVEREDYETSAEIRDEIILKSLAV